MTVNIPYEIGDTIVVGGVPRVIRGIHIYVTGNGKVVRWRFYVGDNKFVSLKEE